MSFSDALPESLLTTSRAEPNTSIISVSCGTVLSSRRESLIISSIREMSLADSSFMVPANPATSSSLTMPEASISETPYIDVKGVFSSWDTLDVNSRLSFSPFSLSVTSMTIRIAPVTSSSSLTGLEIIS